MVTVHLNILVIVFCLSMHIYVLSLFGYLHLKVAKRSCLLFFSFKKERLEVDCE